jgi:hypothetical protein
MVSSRTAWATEWDPDSTQHMHMLEHTLTWNEELLLVCRKTWKMTPTNTYYLSGTCAVSCGMTQIHLQFVNSLKVLVIAGSFMYCLKQLYPSVLLNYKMLGQHFTCSSFSWKQLYRGGKMRLKNEVFILLLCDIGQCISFLWFQTCK